MFLKKKISKAEKRRLNDAFNLAIKAVEKDKKKSKKDKLSDTNYGSAAGIL